MGKLLLNKTTQAVTESVLRQLMPQLDDRLSAIAAEVRLLREEIRTLDAKIDSLREEMLDRFERATALVNEVAHRITRVEGKLEGYMEAMRGVVLPAQAIRRKRAG